MSTWLTLCTDRKHMYKGKCSDSVLLLGFTAAMMQNASPTASSTVMDDKHVVPCFIVACDSLLLLLLFLL